MYVPSFWDWYFLLTLVIYSFYLLWQYPSHSLAQEGFESSLPTQILNQLEKAFSHRWEMKAEEEEEKDTDSTVQHKADPRPPVSRVFISIPGRQAFCTGLHMSPKLTVPLCSPVLGGNFLLLKDLEADKMWNFENFKNECNVTISWQRPQGYWPMAFPPYFSWLHS